MLNADAEVEILAGADNPRAKGKKGRILDEVPPGELTEGQWTVNRISILTGPVLCHPHELHAAGR
ncbi:hypothetical protein OG590_40150 (plasmid) [Streptomyces goshikiensis]|uniref:hypothetical protein n=1 Tax=Streptomyces goshikiensis TaxID=1942 RepID=UPI002F909A20|nr:hypothetical protein OG590_40150 [Streptomyces goshikiensis]